MNINVFVCWFRSVRVFPAGLFYRRLEESVHVHLFLNMKRQPGKLKQIAFILVVFLPIKAKSAVQPEYT